MHVTMHLHSIHPISLLPFSQVPPPKQSLLHVSCLLHFFFFQITAACENVADVVGLVSCGSYVSWHSSREFMNIIAISCPKHSISCALPHPPVRFSVFWVNAVLVHFSLISEDIEHFFKYSSVICISSFRNCFFLTFFKTHLSLDSSSGVLIFTLLCIL